MYQGQLQQKQLSQKSVPIELTPTIFQSMINNLGSNIHKMNLHIEFKSIEEKNEFMMAVKRSSERDEDEINLSDEDQAVVEDVQIKQEVIKKPQFKETIQCFTIQQRFEMSILLRQKYMDKLKEIGQRNRVKFMVIPMKVKILGPLRDRIDDAQDQYRTIKDNICLQIVSNYGKEIYQSRYFRKLLRDTKVQIVQILRKYFIWFQKNKTNPSDLLKHVFMETKHRLYPLMRDTGRTGDNMETGKGQISHGKNVYLQIQDRITNKIMVNLKAIIFQQFVSKRLNEMEDRQQRRVQLSEDRKNLVFHLDAEQQFEMQKKIIEEIYQPYKYLYFAFNKSISDQQLMKLIQKCKEEPSFKKNKSNQNNLTLYTQIVNSFVGIAYTEKQKLSKQEIDNHILLKFVKKFPPEILNFRIAVKQMLEQPEDEDWSNRFIFEKNHFEYVTFIGPKNQTKNRYQELIKLYLDGKLSRTKISKSKNKLEEVSELDKTENMVDISRKVDESSHLLIGDSFDQKQMIGERLTQESFSLLPTEISTLAFRFEKYLFRFEQKLEDKQKKYSKQVTKVQRYKFASKDKYFEQIIVGATTFKYRFFKVYISSKFRWNLQEQAKTLLQKQPQLQNFNRWITLFAGGKQCVELQGLFEQGKNIRVQKVQKNYSMKEGYLLQTNLMFLIQAGGNQLPFGCYQIIGYISHLG